MPEAAIDKDGEASAWKGDIDARADPRRNAKCDPEAEALTVQGRSQPALWTSVRAPVRLHHATNGLARRRRRVPNHAG
jgi:hypothetical protein